MSYHSKVLNRFRRTHVYTPPGYHAGQKTYPVFYVLHYREGHSKAWRSDLAMPSANAGEPRPAHVIAHGGGWWGGSKNVDVFQTRFVGIEDGGNGPYPAVATGVWTLPGMTIFRPSDISPFGADKKLPIILWGNGACANTTQEHKNFGVAAALCHRSPCSGGPLECGGKR